MKYEELFSPITMRGCTWPNRVQKTSAVNRLATEDGHLTDALKEVYRRTAKGGPGSIVVEAAAIQPSKSSFNLRISDDTFIPELQELVGIMRQANADTKIGLQLLHFLKTARSGWRQKVEDLKPEELSIIPSLYVDATKRAITAGFDFIEIHMAHFTTLSCFLSLRNQRNDKYGGNFEGRLRLPVEVYQAVRSAGGEKLPVGIRINGEDFIKEGNTLLQSTRIARRFAELGVDYISVSAGEKVEDAEPPKPNSSPFGGTGYSGYRMSPRWYHPDGPNVFLAEGIRKYLQDAGLNTPIVIAGKIRTPEHSEEILQRGQADVIGLCRALLCDPDWPMKAKNGRAKDIVRCSACGSCSDSDANFEPTFCARWPEGSTNPPDPFLPKQARPAKLRPEFKVDNDIYKE